MELCACWPTILSSEIGSAIQRAKPPDRFSAASRSLNKGQQGSNSGQHGTFASILRYIVGKPRMTAEKPAKPETLESWKEIAAYLNRDVRTVRRWEKDRGLPVRRLPGTRPGVYARIAEID